MNADILVIDDTPANLHLLVEILKAQGYTVRPAPSGKHALAVAQTAPIDLILLDIMMPELDGYEVCRRLKAQAEIEAERTCRQLANLKISVFDQQHSLITDNLYAKVTDVCSQSPQTFRVSFTFVPPEVEEFFNGRLYS